MRCGKCGNEDNRLLELDPGGWLYCMVCAMVTWWGRNEETA